MLQVYRLSPGRTVPFNTGVGFPVPQYIRFKSGSYVPVIHTLPPLVVLGVPTGGVASHCHWVAPVSGSMERINPCRLSKSPDAPTTTWFPTIKGDIVAHCPLLESATSTSHFTLPFFASRHKRWASDD